MYRPTTPWSIICLAAMMVIILSMGCGYRLAGRGSLPGGYPTIAVQVLENRTSETGIEILVTNALINELNRRRQGSVTSAGEAGAFLRGAIEAISWNTVARRGSNTAAERRVYATISLRMTDKNGKILWKRAGLSAEQAYTVVEGDKPATEINRRQAIGELSQRLAENVYRGLIDNF